MESATQWALIPYRTEDARAGWYRKSILQKINGILVTGFKIDWQRNEKRSSGIELFDWFEQAPIQSVFLPQPIYRMIETMDAKACIIETSHCATVKVACLNRSPMPEFCFIASTFIRKVEDKELHTIQTIDAFVGGF